MTKTETFISQAAVHGAYGKYDHGSTIKPPTGNIAHSGDRVEPFSWGDYLKTLTPSCPHDCLWDACRLPSSA